LVAETLPLRYSGSNVDVAREARCPQVLSMLTQKPGLQYTLGNDAESDPGAVILILASAKGHM
jgi:hypothetical protein